MVASSTGDNATLPMQSRYSKKVFRGILVDPGCSIISTGGLAQYKAYCSFVGQTPSIDSSKQASIILGDVRHRAIGMAGIRFPVGSTFFEFNIYLLDLFLPLLLSLADMDRMKVSLNNVRNLLLQEDTRLCPPITTQYGHAFLRWTPTIHVCFTEPELWRLHRRFGHPHSTNLIELLRKKEFENITPDTLCSLQDIERHCHQCQRVGPAHGRFKFTNTDYIDFNHSVYLDVFYIKHPRSTARKSVLHVVDEATRFQAGLRLQDLRAETVWFAL